jgi:hypothetical protein
MNGELEPLVVGGLTVGSTARIGISGSEQGAQLAAEAARTYQSAKPERCGQMIGACGLNSLIFFDYAVGDPSLAGELELLIACKEILPGSKRADCVTRTRTILEQMILSINQNAGSNT